MTEQGKKTNPKAPRLALSLRGTGIMAVEDMEPETIATIDTFFERAKVKSITVLRGIFKSPAEFKVLTDQMDTAMEDA